ncbi:MAG: hypothetical protein A2293_02050 [Elusimicrobia bacterium RIFOXYB2_FULL_49_7]|nr:MAG: hypothetical protein A2293_02050 [Elusimicrobia bacterium RIFOXYB2_FULL_49_7]
MKSFPPLFEDLLNAIPPRLWNNISYLASFFSIGDIGSPISFDGDHGLSLREVDLLTISENERREFLSFCYPQELNERSLEIEYDRAYWPNASTFILRDETKEIVGCAQFVVKRPGHKLPVEWSRIASGYEGEGNYFAIEQDVGEMLSAEIYRLRRSFNITPEKVNVLVTMLFKAIWAKIVETGTAYTYITCDGDSRELRNMYLKRLYFQEAGKMVHFGNHEKKWNLLRKNCLLHEERFATLSKRHFQMQTYFRTGLKRKKLRIAA